MVPILFDLDGTLVDPLPGILANLDKVCPELGLPLPSPAQVRPHIGPGIRGLFVELLGTQEGPRLDAALEAYWGNFEALALPRHALYPGIALLIPRLRRHGHPLFVVTHKPTPFARRLLHQLDLLLDFEEVLGSELREPQAEKAALITALVKAGLSLDGGCLVGDRAGDMSVASQFGLRPLGVTYGYGSRQELETAGAAHCFAAVSELDEWLAGEYPGPEIHDIIARAE